MLKIFLVKCRIEDCLESARIVNFFRRMMPEEVYEVPYGSDLANTLLDRASREHNGAVHPVWGIIDDNSRVHLLETELTAVRMRKAHETLRTLQAQEGEAATA